MSEESTIPNPVKFAEATLQGFKKKADHNKNESLWCFIAVVSCSLLSPLFVTLGDGLVFGKIIPSVLSLTAAASTAWLQLRKPQTLWALYRDCQRRIEDHLYKYRYHLGEYAGEAAVRESLLADHVRAVAWDAHIHWLPLVPTPEAIDLKKTSIQPTENNDQRSHA
jgi:hypothetical protein